MSAVSANAQRARVKDRHLTAARQRVEALRPKPRSRPSEHWFSAGYHDIGMSSYEEDRPRTPPPPPTREQRILLRKLGRENTRELLAMFHERKGRHRNGRRKPRWILAVDAAGQ